MLVVFSEKKHLPVTYDLVLEHPNLFGVWHSFLMVPFYRI